MKNGSSIRTNRSESPLTRYGTPYKSGSRPARTNTHHCNKGGRPARNLLSGLLAYGSCGGHYVLRDGRAYACSASTNGRDFLCDHKRSLERAKVETPLLGGIKSELLAPDPTRRRDTPPTKSLRELSNGGCASKAPR